MSHQKILKAARDLLPFLKGMHTEWYAYLQLKALKDAMEEEEEVERRPISYTCSWSVDVEAMDPEGAATIAEALMADRKESCWEVRLYSEEHVEEAELIEVEVCK